MIRQGLRIKRFYCLMAHEKRYRMIEAQKVLEHREPYGHLTLRVV